MVEKRPHADLAIKFYSDSKMKCWMWYEDSQRWLDIGKPDWSAIRIYEVSETKPTYKPKKKVTMAGITFNAPETEAPEPSTRYWYPDTISILVRTFTNCWNDGEFDRHYWKEALST